MSGIDPVLPDARSRERALTEHDRTLLVEAGAGSGKTGLLAGRVVMLLMSGVVPRDIVAITFTEAAASELLGRIGEYVDDLKRGKVPKVLRAALLDRLTSVQQAALESAASDLDQLTCTTIHGFCFQLIRPYPVETGLDPGATIIEPGEAKIVYQELLNDWLMERFGRRSESEASTSIDFDNDLFAELVRREPEPGKAIGMIASLADFLRSRRDVRAPEVSFRPEVLEALRSEITAFGAWYDGCGLVEESTEAVVNELRKLAKHLDTAAIGPAPISTVHLIRLLFSHPVPSCRHGSEVRFKQWGRKGKWETVAKEHGRTRAEGGKISEAGSAHYEQCNEAYRQCMEHLTGVVLHGLTAEFDELHERYRHYKRDRALLDFDDLLHHARLLLKEHESVRQALAKRYPRVLVDEFQDTDPVQAEIFWWLCGDADSTLPWEQRRLRPGSLFLVGDPKQAIYRFRGADVDTYVKARQSIADHDSDAIVEITANFRSLSSIIDFVNSRFRDLLAETEGQPGFTALSAVRKTADERPAVAAFEVPVGDRHKDKGKLVIDEVRRQEAKEVADLVRCLVGHYPVEARGNERPCRYGDIALLAPTGTNLWIYEDMLEKAEIPITTQAGKGFFRRQEIKDLIALARTLADGQDTLAFGALLRSPLVGLSEETIADAITALSDDKRLYLWTSPSECADADSVLRETLEALQMLAREAHRVTPYQLMGKAIEALNIRPLLRARHHGSPERALANVELFLEMARPYAVRGLSDFARAMWRKWEDTESEVEGRPDAVRESVSIITIHSAKGLEWPIVIPINTMTGLRDQSAYLHRRSNDTIHFKLWNYAGSTYASAREEETQQQQREQVRLWYVALTRACDLLLLPRQSERSKNDWMSLVALGLDDLPEPVIDGAGKSPPRSGEESKESNTQDETIWREQAQTIAALHRRIVWRQPSRHEAGERESVESSEPVIASEMADEPTALIDTDTRADVASTVKGSRERGLILHKLIEEILNGEIVEDLAVLENRARELMTELSQTEADESAGGLHAPELAACVLRGLELPEITALRERLVPEMSVYGATDGERETTLVSGVADAIALDADGNPEVVIDWKSDVAPSEVQLRGYREQIGDYLSLCGASRGLIVFLTSGRIVPVA